MPQETSMETFQTGMLAIHIVSIVIGLLDCIPIFINFQIILQTLTTVGGQSLVMIHTGELDGILEYGAKGSIRVFAIMKALQNASQVPRYVTGCQLRI